MNNEFAGRLMVFRGDDEQAEQNVLCEVTQFTDDGRVEIAFNYGKDRFYLAVLMQDVIAHVAALQGEKP